MVKDWDHYQELALRTLNARGHLENVMHCTVGMASEIAEFIEHPVEKREPRIGEVGDGMWYAAVLGQQLGIKFSTTVGMAEVLAEDINTNLAAPFKSHDIRAVIASGHMLSLVKGSWFYGKELDVDKMHSQLVRFVSALLDISHELDMLPLDVATINIKKLLARFPDKFDAVRAINRDYATESVAAGIEIS